MKSLIEITLEILAEFQASGKTTFDYKEVIPLIQERKPDWQPSDPARTMRGEFGKMVKKGFVTRAEQGGHYVIATLSADAPAAAKSAPAVEKKAPVAEKPEIAETPISSVAETAIDDAVAGGVAAESPEAEADDSADESTAETEADSADAEAEAELPQEVLDFVQDKYQHLRGTYVSMNVRNAEVEVEQPSGKITISAGDITKDTGVVVPEGMDIHQVGQEFANRLSLEASG